MKNKIIILFIALLGLSWYASISTMVSNPKEMQSHLKQAEALDEKGIYVDAIDEYQSALTYNPNDVSILMKIADDYLLIDKSKKYVSTLKQAIELETEGSEDALNELMQYYLDNDEEDKAARYLRDYVEQSPDVEYAQKWYLQLKGSYKELYCRYDQMYGMYNDYMVVKAGDYLSVIDASGNRILDASYTDLTSFSEDGYARTTSQDGKVIYIDTDGLTRVVPDEEYTDLGLLMDSRISASKDGKYGYLDENAEPVTDFNWDNITAFNHGGAAELNGNWAIISSKGKEKTDYIYEDVIVDEYGIACYQGCMFVKKDGKYILVNNKGEEVSDQQFDDAKPFTESGYAAVSKNGKWGFVDAEGKKMLDYQYDDALSFSNGYAAVCEGNQWGYVDTEGNLIIDTVFLEATSFSSEGTVAVKYKDEDEDEEVWRLIKLNIASD